MKLLQLRKESTDDAYRHERELAEAEHAYDGQLEAAKTELRIKHDKDVSDIEVQQAEHVAQKWRQQFDEVARTAQSLVHTLFIRPAEFGKQLGSTLHEATLKPITEGIGNMAARAITPLMHGSDGQGGISGIFKGMFGGGRQNPVKAATDLNTAVTAQNSVAIAALTAVLAAGLGMGAPTIAEPTGIPGGISLPAI